MRDRATTGLTKRYRRGKGWFTAVDDVTLFVPPGQVLGLLGPNGAGKTTTIKMICGLILPSAGTIRLNGYDVARRRLAAVWQIGAVLEGSRNVCWPLSAWQNLMYFGRLKGLRGTEIRPRAQRLLTGLGLWEQRHETVGSYSRGPQQKVAIAAALITDPPIILLDEPTIGLDVEAARTFKDWITRPARDEGKTVVLSAVSESATSGTASAAADDDVGISRAGLCLPQVVRPGPCDRNLNRRFHQAATQPGRPVTAKVAGMSEPAGRKRVRCWPRTPVDGRTGDERVSVLRVPGGGPAADRR